MNTQNSSVNMVRYIQIEWYGHKHRDEITWTSLGIDSIGERTKGRPRRTCINDISRGVRDERHEFLRVVVGL